MTIKFDTIIQKWALRDLNNYLIGASHSKQELVEHLAKIIAQ